MKPLASLAIPGAPDRRIELLQGDLSAPGAARFDLLVVSAFPDNYVPTEGSLIGALHRRGVSLAELAARKEIDLRQHFSCWLSGELPSPDLGFRRILCFEPQVRGEPPSVVGDIFRALAPILGERPELRSVAMPLVATGNQRWSVPAILDPLLDGALNWMRHGLPLERLMIVAFDDEDAVQARELFEAWVDEAGLGEARSRSGTQHAAPEPQATVGGDEQYDLFISYARENAPEVDRFAAAATRCRPGLTMFLDRKDLAPGSAWQPQIFETLDRCRKVVAFLSPDYLQSKVCIEEFNIAWARGREIEQDLIFPVYLYSAALPTYMKYRSYVDCREGHHARIEQACASLLRLI